MLCIPDKILFEWSNKEEWNGRGIWHVWDTGEVRRKFCWGELRVKDHLKDLGIDRRVISKYFAVFWMLYAFFWVIPRRLNFLDTVILHLSAYEDGKVCSETSAYKIQTPRNYPEESTQYQNRYPRSGMVRHGLDWSGSGWGQVTGACGCGKELLGSIKCGKFLA
jgi:hypothetical protein